MVEDCLVVMFLQSSLLCLKRDSHQRTYPITMVMNGVPNTTAAYKYIDLSP